MVVRCTFVSVAMLLHMAQPAWSGCDHHAAFAKSVQPSAFAHKDLFGGLSITLGRAAAQPMRCAQRHPSAITITVALASGKSKKKSRGAGDVGGIGTGSAPTARPARSEAAILADLKVAVAEVGVGFDASALDLERVSSLLGDLEDYNGIVPVWNA